MKDDVIATVRYAENVDSEDDNEETGQMIQVLTVGDQVVVLYESKCYLCLVTNVEVKESARVNVIVYESLSCCWLDGPTSRFEILYREEQIVKKLNPSFPIDSRGGWQFAESILNNSYVFSYLSSMELIFSLFLKGNS